MSNGISIPMGSNHFIRELSSVLNISEEITNSMIGIQYSKNNDELEELDDDVNLENDDEENLEEDEEEDDLEEVEEEEEEFEEEYDL